MKDEYPNQPFFDISMQREKEAKEARPLIETPGGQLLVDMPEGWTKPIGEYTLKDTGYPTSCIATPEKGVSFTKEEYQIYLEWQKAMALEWKAKQGGGDGS